MDRREFLRLAGMAPFASLAPLGIPWTPSVDYPNILVIVTDDQPFRSVQEIEGFGQGMPKLHSILRTEGFEFTRAYATTPKCAPNRANLQTGKYPTWHGIRSNEHASERFKSREADGERLPPQSLAARLHREAGYNCGFFGRWQVDYNETPTWTSSGYQRWVATVTPTGLPVKINMDGKIRKPGINRREETPWLTERLVAWIEGNPQAGLGPIEEPWFAVLAPNSPHGPYLPSTANMGTFSSVAMPQYPNFNHYDPNKPEYVRRDPELTNSDISGMQAEWRGKMEEIQDIDDAIERIAEVIDFEETYVFFTSDNGYLFGEHRQTYKASPYEESSRLPLFVRGPSVREGASSGALTSTVDITSTIYELAGLDSSGLDGRSLLAPIFSDAAYEWRDALYLYQPFDTQGHSDVPGWHAIRTDEYMYVEYMTRERELYDMANDPYQLSNIADSTDAVTLHSLSSKLTEMKRASGEDLRDAEMSAEAATGADL